MFVENVGSTFSLKNVTIFSKKYFQCTVMTCAGGKIKGRQ
jgi:hypothetical protein